MIQAGINPELINLIIKDRKVIYSDRIWSMGVQILPPDKEMEKKIIMSRNKYPPNFINQFKLSDKDIKEYEQAKTDEEIAELAIKDCQLKGYKLIGRKDESV
jgi:hypothetical protein